VSILMMWGYYDGWSWLWMGGMMLAFWAAIILLAVFVMRGFADVRARGDAAMETLRRRFAAGEISYEEFEKSKQALTDA